MTVLFEERPGLQGLRIGVATLAAPQNLNALSLPMIETLQAQLDTWAAEPDIACVLLRGEGEKAFCAGGDVRQLVEACRRHPGEVPPLASRFFADEYRLDYSLYAYPKPLLCWGHGYVMGGGMGLLQGAGIRIVTPSSRLCMPEISIGLFPDVGGSWFLSRLPGRLGLFLALGGAQINTHDALLLGLADRVLLEDQQEALLTGLAQLNWERQPERQLLSLLKALELEARARLPAPQWLPLRPRIDGLLDVADLRAAWQAMSELRADPDSLLSRAGRTLHDGCPLTAHLIWEQLRRARHLSLAEALRMEYTLSLNCCRHPEFAEGVRARLIDRDNRPRWHWPDIDQVPASVIEAHFQPTWEGPHPLANL